ncbi:MAG: type IV fimbrial biogenesis protein FimT [Phenylobacterium sp.]|jgi:type IV fimbrial biogenesis protein FimT
MKQPSGLTLIDLLITIAIVSITAGLTLPSLTQTLAESRAQMYMKSLGRVIMYTRSYAITQGHAVTICPLVGGKCKIDWSKNISVFIDRNMDRRKSQDERLLKVVDDPGQQDYLTYPRRGITYRPDGSINGYHSGTFRYCPLTKTSEFSKGLVVNQAGRPRFRNKNIECK